MKKLLILSIIVFTSIIPSKASHVLGGEIGWTCLANGRYIFYMNVYRDCSGIPLPFTNETITIVGSPLPEDASGNAFSTIVMQPDSNRWIDENKGDISPSCSNQYGNPYSCANNDQTVQQFFYKSSPITLAGNPNRNGWKFYWESVCCRPGAITNVQTTATMLLRAVMYRTKDLDDKDPCIDSSPRFIAYPTAKVCRARLVNYSNMAIDTDLDSLVYSWSRPINPPFETPVPLTYNSGFSPNNPTPDTSFDSRNIPATIDSVSGQVNMAVFSGTQTQYFITVTKVESYRDGVKIAEVYREVPIRLINCDSLPNGKVNKAPTAVINGDTTLEYTINATAGQAIDIPIEVFDNDFWDNSNTKEQVLSMRPEGLLFSRDRASATPCQVTYGAGQNLFVEPCAYLNNLTPSLNNTAVPPQYQIRDTGSIQTNFVWQTDCGHLLGKFGPSGTNESKHSFVLEIQDDACPVPGSIAPTITVSLKDPVPLTAPIMKGINVGLDGKITYQWVPPIDSAFSFEKYLVEEQKTIDGIPVVSRNFNSFIPKDQWDYKQEYKSQLYAIFRYRNNNPVDGFNILQKIPNRDWYMRMTAVSGCTDDVESNPSDPVRIMELETNSISPAGRKQVELTWNSPKNNNAETYNYFNYEAKTRYYIWQNDSTSLSGLTELPNWYLRDSTYSTAIEISSNVCSEYAAFRIEARDTIITYKRGNGLNAPVDSLDTLIFSTFSVIDTAYLNYAKPKVQRKAAEVLISDYPADYYEWIDCNADTALANGAQREFILKDTGSYAVITQNGGCIDTSNCFKVSVDLNDSIVRKGKASLESLETLANYQWYNCNSNSIIQGATNRKYIASDTGKYAVIVSVFNFADTSTCVPVELNLNDSIVLIGKDTLKSLDDDASYKWYNCGENSIIQGATAQTFVMTDTGYYAVIVSDFGYSDTSNCYPYFPIGLPEQSFKEGIVVYPNPTNEKLSIRLNKNYKNVQLRVISIHGQVVQEKQINQQQLIELNLTGDAGIYFIQLTNQKGERANLKVVKQ